MKEKIKLGPIETIKSKGKFPMSGTPVQILSKLGSTTGMIVNPQYLTNRKENVKGTYEGVVPGHGGDVWWVKHEDGSIGAYMFTEVTDVSEVKEA